MLKRRKALTEALIVESPDTAAGEPLLVAAFEGEAWMLDVVLAGGGDLYSSCGGMGTCGTCRVIVTEGSELLEPRNEVETEMAEIRNYDSCERLACQTLARNGVKIRIP